MKIEKLDSEFLLKLNLDKDNFRNTLNDKDFQLNLVQEDPWLFLDLCSIYNIKIFNKVQLELVKKDLKIINYIKNPCNAAIIHVVLNHNGFAKIFIKKEISNYIKKIILSLHPEYILELKNPQETFQRLAINKDYRLYYLIKNPTDKIKLEIYNIEFNQRLNSIY